MCNNNMLWPLVAAASAVGSLFVLPSPRPLLAIGAAALVAFLFLGPPRPPPVAQVSHHTEVDRILGSIRFVRSYSAADVEGVGRGLDRFMASYQKAAARPSAARLEALEMARSALVNAVLSLTYSLPPSCMDHAIVDAARATNSLTSACIERVRAALGLAPDTAPEPIAFDVGVAVA